MNNKIRVLILEDNEDDALLEINELREAGFILYFERVKTLVEMRNALLNNQWDCIISDYAMPQFSGLDALAEYKSYNLDIPFILVSGTVGEDIAVDAMRSGAHDYIMKENLTRLAPALSRELREAEIRRMRRETEAELNHSEEKYKVLVENAKDYIFMVDAEDRIISINSFGAGLFGKQPHEIIGMNIKDVFPPEMAVEYIRNLREIFATGVHSEHEGMMIIGEKKYWIRTILNPVLDEAGRIGAVICVEKDITERKLAEEKIRDSEKFLSSLVNTIADAIITVSLPDRKIKFDNKAVTTITDYTPEEITGKQTSIFFPTMESFLEYGVKIGHALQNGMDVLQDELVFVKKNGEKIWCDIRNTFLGGNEPPYLSIVVIRDITEKKKILEELTFAKEKAEEMNRLKSCFLANMSHELRTPMIGILGFSEMLAEESDDPGTRQWAQLINQGSHRLMDTLNLILDFSRIEAEKLEIETTAFDIMKIIDTVCIPYRETAKEKSLYFEIDREESSLMIQSDLRFFTEAIKNLIDNAFKFTDCGGVTVKIKSSRQGNERNVIIEIHDTGVGIAQENLHLIWDEFRQVSEGRARGYEGTGLGLTITKKFIEKMGGNIAVRSTIGVGSTFTIQLPGLVKQPVEVESTHILRENTQERAFINKELCETLYVEDDPTAFKVVSTILKDLCRCDMAFNAKEALKKLREKKYSCILMDINLGIGDDGLVTTEKIRKLDGYKNVPIVAVTAFAMAGDKEEFLRRGCSHYIAKPFTKNELILLMQNILSETKQSVK